MNNGPAAAGKHVTAIRTGSDLILATRPYAVDNPLTSWMCILSTTALWLAAMAGTLWNFNLTAKIICSFFTALLMLRLFVIYHDQQHRAILPKSRLAGIFMRVFGILALSPNSIWQSSHNHHHKHNSKIMGSHIGSFPVMTTAHYAKASRATRFKYLFQRHPLTILFGYLFCFIIGMCIIPFMSKPREHFECLIALLVHVGIGFLLVHFLGWQAWLLVTTRPALHHLCHREPTCFTPNTIFPACRSSTSSAGLTKRRRMESSSYMKTSSDHGLVYRQHRLPSHPSSERAHPVLSPARGVARYAGAAESQNHFAASARYFPVPPPESLGRRGATHGPPSADNVLLNPPPGSVRHNSCSRLHRLRSRWGAKSAAMARLRFTGVAPAESARAGDLTFAEKETYFAAAEQSAASAVLVPAGFESSQKVLIRVKNPRVAIARVLPLFFPPQSHPPGVHEALPFIPPRRSIPVRLSGLTAWSARARE